MLPSYVDIDPNSLGYANKLVCSPSKKKEFDKYGTCYSKDGLLTLVQAYNQVYPDNSIQVSQDVTKKELWQALKIKIAGCQNEWCWIEKPFAKKIVNYDLFKNTFKPKIPVGKEEWLSTLDIENVMNQFQSYDPTFEFFGAVPIDFEEIIPKFKNFDLDKYRKKGISKIGVVFNEDPHYKSGSHWIALFIDIDNREMQYYNSFGIKPPDQVKRWLKKINEQESPMFTFVYNNKQHQYGNNECGVYCLHFLILRLLGVPFKTIVDTIILDQQMNAKRKVFFTP